MNPASPIYGSDPAPAACPELTGTLETEFCIIGGGITGLSTALHLGRLGKSVVVLESEQPGFGASGRNGGQINPGLKTSPETVERDFGRETGKRLVAESWSGPDLVFDLIRSYDIACDARRGGTIRALTSSFQEAPLRELTRQCTERSMPVEWLSRDDLASLTGTNVYLGGTIDRRGGQLDPLAYTQGLARAAKSEGCLIFGNTPALGLTRSGTDAEGYWRVRTPKGVLKAKQIVFTTNGYSGPLWDRLRRSVVPLYSGIIASETLPDALQKTILANREVLYELGDITVYYRTDTKNRLLIGGRSASRDLSGPEAFSFLRTYAEKLWPALEGHAWTHGWNGQLAMTTDHYPHWHAPEDGITAALGYNGRGVAFATVTGKALAEWLAGEKPPLIPPSRLKPLPFHNLWKPAVAARVIGGRAIDRLRKH